jgi:hypothetical protein
MLVNVMNLLDSTVTLPALYSTVTLPAL